jgi:hypothetical protein
MNSAAPIGLIDGLGMGVGFCLTLALFSLLAGDRLVARLAQHLLVGAALGYAALLSWRAILQPRLLAPLWADPLLTPWLWLPLGLGILLWAGGIATIVQPAAQRWRWLRWAALLPVALLVGVGLAVGLIGVIQGSLLPQLWRTIGPGIDWVAPPDALLSSVITLLVTTATLLALTVGQADRLLRPTAPLYPLLAGWIGLGKRALWLAAGALFARLAASYLSLLIGQLHYWRTALNHFGLWPLVEWLWQ